MSADPFDTAAVRARVLDAWRASPARFREDANAEADLRVGGYRDRLLTELAANASDAALGAGVPGHLALRAVDGELRAANTGAPLDAEGVSSLAALRASAKRGESSVGHFGVGFAAVLAVTDDPEIVSTTGGVRFSAARTREAVAEVPGPAEELERRRGEVPVLRLPWPSGAAVPEGFDTEVRLPLRPGLAAADLLDLAAEAAGDLLLALPGLGRIDVGERVFRRVEHGAVVAVDGPGGVARWRRHRHTGTLLPEQVAGLGAEAAERTAFAVCWAIPVDAGGAPVPHSDDVLHAPTPTDERLSLPARLFATVPLEPGRRRLLPGTASDAVLAAAAGQYPALLTSLPGPERALLLPAPEFPRSEVDAAVRDGVSAALRNSAWLPTASGGDVSPDAACVLDGATPELVELLAGAVPGLAIAEFAAPGHAPALHALGVRRLGWAALADALTGVHRPPAWWRRLYAALEVAGADTGELGALPVPLADGRVLPGARGAVLPEAVSGELPTDLRVPGLRIVHPEADHRLLERLGARRAGAAELLDTGELAAAVARSVEDADAGLDPAPLADFVFGLLRAAGTGSTERPWLGALALRGASGGYRRAAELVLPDAALREVLDPEALGEDGPLGVLDAAEAAARDRELLVAAGVLDSFAVVLDEEPAGPDHDLDAEADWWERTVGDGPPPTRVLAVRDLDLVADEGWEDALRLLAAEPRTWRALTEPSGYTAYYVAEYALLAGAAPRRWRLAGATGLAGLYEPVPGTELPERVLAAAGVRDSLVVADAADAEDLLARLGDRERQAPPALVLRAHAALAEAVRSGTVDVDAVAPPSAVRCLDGAAADTGGVAVLDEPWTVGLLGPERLVGLDGSGDPAALADLLDVPVASEQAAGAPESRGEIVSWAELAAVRAACDLLGVEVPAGPVTVHDRLVVRGRTVPWWVAEGSVHAADSTDGLARALAWTLDRWRDRHLLAVLLDDPTPVTLLA